MQAKSIRAGMKIGKSRVRSAVTGTATFQVGGTRFLAPARIVTMGNGRVVSYQLTEIVDVKGWAEPLPGGNVPSKNVRTPDKVRASAGKWRGESVRGSLTTREHDLITKTPMYAQEKVCGRVGADRNGVGDVRLTGPSFPPPSEW